MLGIGLSEFSTAYSRYQCGFFVRVALACLYVGLGRQSQDWPVPYIPVDQPVQSGAYNWSYRFWVYNLNTETIMSTLTTLANPFQFESLDVRTAVDSDNNVWFCAKDVCAILDIAWTGATITLDNMPESWFMVMNLMTIKGERDTYFINESGLYWLIFRSNKPKAKAFANWVLGEVLPQIRKHGFYGSLPAKDYIAVVKQIADLTERLTDTKNAFTYQLLLNPLRNLCNLAGHPMPDIALISQQIDQADLFSEGGVK